MTRLACTDEPELVQLLKVNSGETDGDESGREWKVHYTLFQTKDDEGVECFDLYITDEKGSGHKISRGYHRWDMMHLVFRLGEFVCYGTIDEEFRNAKKSNGEVLC